MIRVGTRGSALALTQARWVAEQLDEPFEVVTVATSGDEMGGGDGEDKSRWVSGLERALLEGEIDIAVHSAKDVPARLADGLGLVAIPWREDARDCICGAAGLRELPSGARVGTSSLRRAAQLRALREDLDVVDVRGNVDTRLRKLADGEYDALVLAAAGLKRLGRAPDGLLGELVPAAGQGALAIEARQGEATAAEHLDHAESRACVLAERELTRELDASCNTPVGAFAELVDEGGRLRLSAWLGRPDGSEWLRDSVVGDLEGTGKKLAERLRSVGAQELLG